MGRSSLGRSSAATVVGGTVVGAAAAGAAVAASAAAGSTGTVVVGVGIFGHDRQRGRRLGGGDEGAEHGAGVRVELLEPQRLVLADRESVATARVGYPIHPQRLDGGTGVVPHHRHHRDVAAVHRQESLDVGAGTLVLHLGRREVGVGVAAIVVPGPRNVLVGARGQCLVRSDVVAIARFELTDRGEDHVDVLGEHDPLTGRGAARLECRAARKARQDEPRHALARPARVERGQRCARRGCFAGCDLDRGAFGLRFRDGRRGRLGDRRGRFGRRRFRRGVRQGPR